MAIFSKMGFAVIPTLALNLSIGAAFAGTTSQSTSVEVENGSSTTQTLEGKPNVSGTVTPAFPSSIAAGVTYSGTSVTNQTSDAGTIQYGDCQFHWSTIMSTNPETGAESWTFSQSVLSGSSTNCKAVAVSENYETGQHSVEFIVDK